MLIASTERELPAVSSVTRCWLRLTCAWGTCAVQHRAEGHAVRTAQCGTAQPAPAQVSCDMAHSSLRDQVRYRSSHGMVRQYFYWLQIKPENFVGYSTLQIFGVDMYHDSHKAYEIKNFYQLLLPEINLSLYQFFWSFIILSKLC